MYEALKQQGQAIAGIWIADVAQQGMSGVMNENKLGNDRKCPHRSYRTSDVILTELVVI
jgi:hypothetical protein